MTSILRTWAWNLFFPRVWLFGFALALASPLSARDRALSVNDVLALERLDRVTASPDGALLAAVVLRGALPGEVFGRVAYEIDPSRGDIWIIDRSTGGRRNITEGRTRSAGAWCATWSPDGQRVAFLSTAPQGAEPQGGDNVRLYIWNRRTQQIRRLGDWAVATQTRYGGAQSKLDIAGPSASAPDPCTSGEDNPPFTWLDPRRLLVAALPPLQKSALIDAGDRIYRHTISTQKALRDGKEVAVSASGSGIERTSGTNQTVSLVIVDVANGRRTEIASFPAYPFNGSLGLRVSPDARRAAVLATVGALPPRSGVPWPSLDGEWLVEKRFGIINLASNSAVSWVDLPAAARLPLALEGWSPDGRTVHFTARREPQDRTAQRFSVDLQSKITAALSEMPEAPPLPRPKGLPPHAELLVQDTKGAVWVEKTREGTFVRASEGNGEQPRQLFALNRHLTDVDLGRTMAFDYIGLDGKPLKAAVLLPSNYRTGKLPVITWVYGGYMVQGTRDYFLDPYMPGIYNMHIYAAKGFAVLIPSIPLERDGTQDHLPALAPSVLPAIDKLIAMGIADPDRIGVMGQSYGGYSALGLATQTSRFRAVVAIAPISDLTAFYGAFDPTARDYPGIEHEKSANPVIAEVGASALQVPPHKDPKSYSRNSPLSFVDQVSSPVLLIHGEHDMRGSMYQSEAFFTELWRQGKTAKLLRYWGEDHPLAASPATVRSVVNEVTSWFEKYMTHPLKHSAPPRQSAAAQD